MILEQTSFLSNMQQQNNILSYHQQQFQRSSEERKRLHRERQERRRREYRSPEEHRYISYMLRLCARDPERFQQVLDEQEHQAYLQRRSPTFNEWTDEILEERQLQDYDFERMTLQERQEVWEQEHLNQLQGNPTPSVPGLPLDNLQQYANFVQE